MKRVLYTFVSLLALVATAVPAAAADNAYFFRSKPMVGQQTAPAVSPSVSIRTATLPSAKIGKPWTYEFGSLASSENVPAGGLSWAGTGLPGWMTLNPATGAATGTPTARKAESFQVATTFGSASASGTFGFQVLDPAVVLAASTLPSASVGKPWSFDFSTLATKQDLETPTLSWASANKPAWMTVSAATGVASGTPTAVGDATYTVVATNVDAVGQRSYTITVGAQTFEVVQIDGGLSHTCALLAGGTVKCWGNNASGQLGTGNTTSTSTANVAATDISTATQIAAGESHTCALLSGGTVKCWGSNANGQIGSGNTISGATQIAAGGSHTCALLSAGTVKCWGLNANGQLGVGNKTSTSTANVAATGISGATQIAAGSLHTCALLAGGTVKCWGGNGQGELGVGDTTDTSAANIAVTGISGATQIDTNSQHTCALLAGGTVKCWGRNAWGQLGVGNTTQSTAASVAATGISGATQVVAGGNHTCALLSGGTVKCWGHNGIGQHGVGDTTPTSVANVASTGVSGATQIFARNAHTCALLPQGTVKCWGNNNFGQLGIGTTTNTTAAGTAVIMK